MTKQEILNVVRRLSFSQGFYGELYAYLMNGTDEAEDTLDMLEEQEFGDAVALIMYIEEEGIC